MEFTIIAAVNNGIIGVDGNIPWHDREDLKMFRNITSTADDGKVNILIVGRKTYEGMPNLESRTRKVMVISKTSVPGVLYAPSLTVALQYSSRASNIHKIFVIGGGQLYSEAINSPYCKEMYITQIVADIVAKTEIEITRFPDIPASYMLRSSTSLSSGSTLQYYQNRYGTSPIEREYLDILNRIMREGNVKNDRTGVGTIGLFGCTLHHEFVEADGRYTFPLLTTKKVFLKGIIHELLFFLRGQVDNDLLTREGVNIWNGNTTREFLDSRGLQHMETGSLGKAYGFQWRHWGAEWRGKNADYTGSGHDQIADILHKLKHEPNSRRIVLSAWNVSDLKDMCLEPCHTMYVFNVQACNGVPKLYCHLTQRSGDMFLGIPFNIASTALLTMILAKAAGIVPGGIMMTIIDAHIYQNHINAVKTQLERTGLMLPTMHISHPLQSITDIEGLSYENFILRDYTPHPAIPAPMAV
jgi:dihydrofolate reductase / thymidylate synthase